MNRGDRLVVSAYVPQPHAPQHIISTAELQAEEQLKMESRPTMYQLMDNIFKSSAHSEF